MNDEIKISSLLDYIEQIIRLNPKKEEGTIYHKATVFRGQYSIRKPVPTLGRPTSGKWTNTYVSCESALISNAIQKKPDFLTNQEYPITILAKMQHFGIYTRLLDVTSSPLVALYFACRNYNNRDTVQDGVVFVFQGYIQLFTNPYVNIIADTYKLTQEKETDLTTFFYRAMKQPYCTSLLYPDWEKMDNNIAFFKQQIENFYIVDAPELSARQNAQHGKYILFPNRIHNTSEQDRMICELSDIETNRQEENIIRLIIPAEIKESLLNELELLEINEASLFPDNLEKVFASIVKNQADRFV